MSASDSRAKDAACDETGSAYELTDVLDYTSEDENSDEPKLINKNEAVISNKDQVARRSTRQLRFTSSPPSAPIQNNDELTTASDELESVSKLTGALRFSSHDTEHTENLQPSTSRGPTRRSTRLLKSCTSDPTTASTSQKKVKSSKRRSSVSIPLDAGDSNNSDAMVYKRIKTKDVREFKKDEMIIERNFYDSTVDRKSYWKYSLDIISPEISLPNRDLLDLVKVFDYQNEIGRHSKMKRLKIVNLVESYFAISELANFPALEDLELDISNKNWSKDGRINQINLPNLKAFVIHLGTSHVRTFEIDTPELQFLLLDYTLIQNSSFKPLSSVISLKDASTVKQLVISGKFQISSLAPFVGVQCLKYMIEDVLKDEQPKILTTLPHLNTVQMNNLVDYEESIPDILTAINNEKQTLINRTINVYYLGVPLECLCKGELGVSKFKTGNHVRLQMQNYGELSSRVDWHGEFNYSTLCSVCSELPIDFHSRYCTILVTSRIENLNNFITFIENCPRLKKLEFKNFQLTQELLDKLGNSSASDSILNLMMTNPKVKLNFDWLLKLTNLAWFISNQEISQRFFPDLNIYKQLEYFECTYDKKRIKIYVKIMPRSKRLYSLYKTRVNSEEDIAYVQKGTLNLLCKRILHK